MKVHVDVLPVTQMTSQGEQIVVEALDRPLLQHVVDSAALVDVANQNVIVLM